MKGKIDIKTVGWAERVKSFKMDLLMLFDVKTGEIRATFAKTSK
jgi:hypothetical protein